MTLAHSSDLVITALGGALGALILRSALKLAGMAVARCRTLAVYDCAVPEPSKPGELRHSLGHRVQEEEKHHCTGNAAWEHDWNPIAKVEEVVTGQHTIYGPYVNDLGKPGFYRVRFRLNGTGFTGSNDAVVGLDVVQAGFGTEKVLRLLGQRMVRAEELSDSYRRFDIVFFAEGTAVYEYRCTVFHGAADQPECRIRFDVIEVYSHPPIWEIL